MANSKVSNDVSLSAIAVEEPVDELKVAELDDELEISQSPSTAAATLNEAAGQHVQDTFEARFDPSNPPAVDPGPIVKD